MSEHSEYECTKPGLGDLLAAYELGLLEGPDQSRFEAHLGECPACLEELYQGAATSEELRADPGRYAALLTQSIRANEPSLLQRLGEFLRRLLRPRVLAPVTAVTAVALMLIFLQPGQLPSSAGLAVIEPLPYQGLQLRGGVGQDLDQNLDQLLTAGMEQYATGNYGAAAVSLGSAWAMARADQEWSDRHQTALFLGLCLLLEGHPDEALEPLGAAVESILLPTAERGTWFLAQAHLLREDPRASLPLLESLLSSPVYRDQAADQLHLVREICDNSYGR